MDDRGCLARGFAPRPASSPPTPYAALHVHPKFNYKMWHVEGWAGLAQWLRERGIASVLTGGQRAGPKSSS